MFLPGRLLLAATIALGLSPAFAEERAPTAAAEPSPWYIEGSAGLLNPGNFTEIVYRTHRTTMTDQAIAGVGVGREVLEIGSGFSLDVGLQLNQRIDEGGTEFAMPITFVFDGFPWRDRLPTRFRLAIGPSYVTKISDTERRKDSNNKGSRALNMFNPEIELGLPTDPSWSAFFRLHHRSGIFKLINGVTGGSTYLTFGVRRRFAIEGY